MFLMEMITVNVDEKVAKKFRQRVAAVYGKKKGALGKAVSEALEEWNTKRTDMETCLQLLEKGMDLGGGWRM